MPAAVLPHLRMINQGAERLFLKSAQPGVQLISAVLFGPRGDGF